ncbi:tetratricopeptide repeat protein [Thalassotalea castellviae]|uniref:Tetratricopeptide repeat protein n=1 Tax=Thalassotalea castellviae TaxID=3075612 RepID=A0ABU2ZWB1_9GAMM|nr:tetratricopeptide repeat protein [Thalassotalea sp. W431]MDT0601994.1 tetratricopeptide repeat protein [Thalassotalea sp. W431]
MLKLSYKKLFIIFSWLFIVSCQSTIATSDNTSIYNELYLDDEFEVDSAQSIESEEEVFALDDEMKLMVTEKLLSVRAPNKRAKRLLRHIFAKENIDLAYQSAANLTASQAYHSQTANCMSLTIMAYALAKEAGLDVKFQDVKVPEYWVRNGQYNMLTGHVNLILTEAKVPNKTVVYGRELLQIDFDPDIYKKSFPKKVITKNTVLAMFYNNKGAHALVDQNYQLSYKYLKQATLVDPSFSSAWGNLGILYKLNDLTDFAEKTYRHAIELDNDNLTALTNLSLLLEDNNNLEQARKIEKMLHDKRIKNPYYHALLADEAFFRGENQKALKHYKRAIRMDNKVHEFYFGIAKVYYALNRIERAENAMNKAIAYNRASAIESQYLAKLNFLKDLEIAN